MITKSNLRKARRTHILLNINNKSNIMGSNNLSISKNNPINLSAPSELLKLSFLKQDLKVDKEVPTFSKASLSITDKNQQIDCNNQKYNQNKEKIHSIVSPIKN